MKERDGEGDKDEGGGERRKRNTGDRRSSRGGEREKKKKAVKLIFCAESYMATDMLRQKPGPGEAAWV